MNEKAEIINNSKLFLSEWYAYTYSLPQSDHALEHYLSTGYKEGKNPNPWFDSKWYLENNSDVAASEENPLVHYAMHGWKDGRDPSSLFSLKHYLKNNPDVEKNEIEPLSHYLLHGRAEGRLALVDEIRNSGIFITNWYLNEYPDLTAHHIDPLEHYLKHGWKEGRNPNPWFDTKWYLEKHPEIYTLNSNPLIHYLSNSSNPSFLFDIDNYKVCQAEDNTKNLDKDKQGFDNLVCFLNSKENKWLKKSKHLLNDVENKIYAVVKTGIFDPVWYCLNYPDIASPELSLKHYVLFGSSEGRLANEFFDTAWYEKQNSDIDFSENLPILHYFAQGWKENKDPSPRFSIRRYFKFHPSLKGVEPLKHYLKYRNTKELANYSTAASVEENLIYKIEKTGLFDYQWYKEKYASEIKQENSELEDYVQNGVDKCRNPNPFFDTCWYLEQNLDVKEAGIHPLLHYAAQGWKEGRNPSPSFSLWKYRRRYLRFASLDIDPLYFHVTKGHDLDYVTFEAKLSNEEDLMYRIEQSGLFVEDWYKNFYEDIRDVEGVDALEHYALFGIVDKRNPNPYFDIEWYINHTPELQVDETWEHPILHYINPERGWTKNKSPSQLFDVEKFFEVHPKIKDAKIEPLAYFLKELKPKGESASIYKMDLKNEANDELENIKDITQITPEAHLIENDMLRGLIDYNQSRLSPSSSEFNPDVLNIHWVMPDFSPGAGGHMTIFRMVHFLELYGHKQILWLYGRSKHDTAESAYDDIIRYFQNISAQVYFIDDDKEKFENTSGDVIIATDWGSVWPAVAPSDFKRRFYFVQDHEPEFYPTGSLARAAQATYSLGFDCICAGPWLEALMQDKYNLWSRKFWLAADTNIYYPEKNKVKNRQARIAVYARHFTARRLVEIALLALEELAQYDIEFHVDFFGADLKIKEAPFTCTLHGVLSVQKLAELYRQADIGLVFSATNYSLVPQEMMACGLPIVELDGENTRAIFPEDTVTLAQALPKDVAAKLAKLLSDNECREKQAIAALKWVKQFAWKKSAQLVNEALLERLRELEFQEKKDKIKLVTKASVVIPTLNGGDIFKDVIQCLKAQRCPWPFEIIVIDSGSNDGSAEFIKEEKDIKFHSIQKKDFGHGKTRNLGVQLSQGEYIAFLTQDALPVDEYWLFNLVSALEHFPMAAGVFGKHYAWPSASPYTKRDLDQHFKQFDFLPLYVDKDTDSDRWERGDIAWRQQLHFYSDNNSCMRRSVWEKIPYPDIEFGEDQVWADQILKAGYGKVYAPNAVVWHSHDYNEQETYERTFTEAQFFKRHFSYILMKSEDDFIKTMALVNKADRNWGKEERLNDTVIQERLQLNRRRFKALLDGSLENTG